MPLTETEMNELYKDLIKIIPPDYNNRNTTALKEVSEAASFISSIPHSNRVDFLCSDFHFDFGSAISANMNIIDFLCVQEKNVLLEYLKDVTPEEILSWQHYGINILAQLISPPTKVTNLIDWNITEIALAIEIIVEKLSSAPEVLLSLTREKDEKGNHFAHSLMKKLNSIGCEPEDICARIIEILGSTLLMNEPNELGMLPEDLLSAGKYSDQKAYSSLRAIIHAEETTPAVTVLLPTWSLDDILTVPEERVLPRTTSMKATATETSIQEVIAASRSHPHITSRLDTWSKLKESSIRCIADSTSNTVSLTTAIDGASINVNEILDDDFQLLVHGSGDSERLSKGEPGYLADNSLISICCSLIDSKHYPAGNLTFIFTPSPDELLLMYPNDSVTTKDVDYIKTELERQGVIAGIESERISTNFAGKDQEFLFPNPSHMDIGSGNCKISSVDELLNASSAADCGHNEVLVAGTRISGKPLNPMPIGVFVERSYLTHITTAKSLSIQEANDLNIIKSATIPVVTAKIEYDPILKFEAHLDKERAAMIPEEYGKMYKELQALVLGKTRLLSLSRDTSDIDMQIQKKISMMVRLLDVGLKANMISALEHKAVIEKVREYTSVGKSDLSSLPKRESLSGSGNGSGGGGGSSTLFGLEKGDREFTPLPQHAYNAAKAHQKEDSACGGDASNSSHNYTKKTIALKPIKNKP